MPFPKRSWVFLGVSGVLLTPLVVVGQSKKTYTPPPPPRTYTPPAPRPYTPPAPRPYTPPAPRPYTPPARPYTPPAPAPRPYTPPAPAPRPYTPPAPAPRPYSPAPESNGGNHIYTPSHPSTPEPSHSYTPNSNSGTTSRPSFPSGTGPLPSSNFSGSHSSLGQVNSSRQEMTGINRRPIPQGDVSVHSNGKLTVSASNGRSYDLRPNGSLASFHKPGETASFRPDGHLASLHTSSMEINRGPGGQRTIVSRRPDHSAVVSLGRNRGYVERPVLHNGTSFTQRTYVVNGQRFSRAYTSYNFHGTVLVHYVPSAYYAPKFYGWAYYPWDAPAAYSWAWANAVWARCDSGYFTPTPIYPGATNWLADFLISQTLANGYDPDPQSAACPGADAQGGDQLADADTAPEDTPLSAETKQAIADEVRQQLSYENAASTSSDPARASDLTDLPQVLTVNHLFIADQDLNVPTTDGDNCNLSAGDVLRLTAVPPADSATADLIVVSSRKADCFAGVTVTLALDNLQEMQNNFRSQIDDGLKTLRDQQGTNGLPAAPYAAIAPPPVPADELPADTGGVQGQLIQQQQQADQAEAGVTDSAFATTATN